MKTDEVGHVKWSEPQCFLKITKKVQEQNSRNWHYKVKFDTLKQELFLYTKLKCCHQLD